MLWEDSGWDPASHLHEQGHCWRISTGPGEMQESIWTREKFPFLECGFIAPESAAAGQIDKAPFANVDFGYFDLGRYKNFIRSLLQGVAPPTDLGVFWLLKKNK